MTTELVNVKFLRAGDVIELGGTQVLIEIAAHLPTTDIELWYSNKSPFGEYRSGIVVFASTAEVRKVK